MAGILKIHSNFAHGLLPGHSWIEYCPVDGQPRTYGTWGNNPTGQGNGLFEDLELGRTSDAARICYITAEQELRLFARIDMYRQMGTQGWTLLSPCSTFAADVWTQATGELLPFKTGLVSNPSTLASSIIEANRRDLLQNGSEKLKPQPDNASASKSTNSHYIGRSRNRTWSRK